VTKSYAVEAGVQRFLDHLRVERGLSANSLAAYGTDLGRFSRELIRRRGNGIRLHQVCEADVLAHLEHLVNTGMAISSQRRHLTAVRCLFRHFLQQELIRADPTVMIELPRGGKALPSYLSIDEIDLLIAAPNRSTPAGLRDAAMLDLAYATGLRVSELVRVRVGDVDFDAGYLRTMGKGRKERLVPVGERALQPPARVPRGPRPEAESRAPIVPFPLEPRSCDDPTEVLADRGGVRAARRDHEATITPHSPTLVRHPHGGEGRRPAGSPGDGSVMPTSGPPRFTRTCRRSTFRRRTVATHAREASRRSSECSVHATNRRVKEPADGT
jgi:integrase